MYGLQSPKYHALMIRTKTVATVGPATRSRDNLAALLDAGVDVLRLNFSHGTLAEHGAVLDQARSLALASDRAVAIMADLCGPKIRIGTIVGEKAIIVPGDTLVIQRGDINGSAERVSTNYPALIDEIRIHDRVLIDDGNIQLQVEVVRPDEVICRCTVGGELSNRKGVNLPDTPMSLPTLTPKDHTDLAWAIESQVDYVAVSFVRQASDIAYVRQLLREAGSDIHVLAKIETAQALDHLDDIIDQADGILVARGDLGVELELARVPLLQKDMTQRCRRVGKPVIIATQMLQSMVTAATPTRAETSDVANAVLDLADAVMLSAETAIGAHPMAAVETIQRICSATEAFQSNLQLDRRTEDRIEDRTLALTSHIALGAHVLAERIKPPLIAVWTCSGASARLLSKQRFNCPIVALTHDPRVRSKLALNYGVIPLCVECPDDPARMIRILDTELLATGLAEPGQPIIVIAGTHFAHTGHNNVLVVHQVGNPNR